MSTTDSNAAFEAYMREQGHTDDDLKRPYGNYFWKGVSERWEGWHAALEWQAATEAAKATGTAGEQSTLIGMEVSMDVSTGDEDFDHRVFGRIEGLMAKGDGTDIILAVEESRNFAADTQAARQPAPVVAVSERDMMIAQAVRQACVNSYGPDDSASDYAEKMGDIDLATVIRAATNRSQP